MESSWKGAGTVLFYRNDSHEVYVLVGKETRWLEDYCLTTDILQRQILEGLTKFSTVEAHAIFEARAKKISQEIGKYVSYDTLLTEDDAWRTHFRVEAQSPDKNFWGIPKGGLLKYTDETPVATAIREFQEETGIELFGEHCQFMGVDRGYHFFMYEVPFSLVSHFTDIIYMTRAHHSGELHRLNFMPLKDLEQHLDHFNGMSRKVLRDYFIPRVVCLVDDD
jgi:8-oxo-dGTP pyrophosphatase MutT (NUDIX family)